MQMLPLNTDVFESAISMQADIVGDLAGAFDGLLSTEPFVEKTMSGLVLQDSDKDMHSGSMLPIKTVCGESIVGEGNIEVHAEVDPATLTAAIEAAIAPLRQELEETKLYMSYMNDVHDISFDRFSINDDEEVSQHTFEVGMSWEEYVDSKLNTAGLTIDSDNERIENSDGEGLLLNDLYVAPEDVIEAGAEYKFGIVK